MYVICNLCIYVTVHPNIRDANEKLRFLKISMDTRGEEKTPTGQNMQIACSIIHYLPCYFKGWKMSQTLPPQPKAPYRTVAT